MNTSTWADNASLAAAINDGHLPSPELVRDLVNAAYDRFKTNDDGTVADYIPALAAVPRDRFGICVVGTNGAIHGIGDTSYEFSIQSVSKPFVFALICQAIGEDAARDKLGANNTGLPFNSVIALELIEEGTHNPMVNAGAIATTSLIGGHGPTERLNRLLAMFRRYIGHDLFIDMATFMSERTTGLRNKAMAYLMQHFGMVDHRVDEALDLYFQQCSVMVSCRDLAVMAATLANHGVNPLTGDRAVDERYIRDILSVMYTCGMYNYAGEWAYTVGIPAKSGVSGGIIAVVPNQIGIAVFSPPLDGRGNSVRGVKVCEELSQHFGLHLLDSSMGCQKFLNLL